MLSAARARVEAGAFASIMISSTSDKRPNYFEAFLKNLIASLTDTTNAWFYLHVRDHRESGQASSTKAVGELRRARLDGVLRLRICWSRSSPFTPRANSFGSASMKGSVVTSRVSHLQKYGCLRWSSAAPAEEREFFEKV
jgi:hypothetical protein